MAVQIQFRRDTGANWASANTVLAEGEMGINTTTNQFKIGNGSTAWNSLSYAPLSGTMADLDDITNVVITSAANGDLLKWNGSAWVNAAGYALLASPTLTGTPSAPTAAANTNTTQIATTAFVTGAVTDLIGGAPGALNTLNELAEAIGDDASYAAGITTALGLKAPLASPTFTGTVTVPTPVNNTDASTKVYVDSTASTTASAAATALTNHEADTTNIHGIADTSILVTTSGTQTLTNKTITTPAGLVKGDVGLGNVDNTADTAKPVSTAGQTALDLKANLASPTFTGTVTIPTGASITAPTGLVKGDVGLGNVDNTSDANKPVSTAGQTALDLKANLNSPTFTGTVTLPDNTVALGTKTTGDYVATITGGTGVSSTAATTGEGTTHSLSIGQAVGTTDNVTFAGVTADNIKVGVTGANEIDTVSGDLTIDSAGGTVTVDDNLTVTGNLTVSGTTTSINTETLTVDDNIIVLNNNVTASPTENAGIEVERGSSTNVVLRWNETDDAWELTNDGSTYSAIATASSVATATTLSVDNLSDTTITSAAAGQFLKYNGSAWVNDAIDLTTDTVGDYVATLTAGTGITLTNNSGEGASPTVTVDTTVIQAKVTNVTDTEIGYLDGVTSAIQTQLNDKAPLASPTFTGTPTLPTGTIATTQTAADSTTAVATTAFVTTADNLKANLASPTFTGTPAAPTATAGTSTTQVATTEFVFSSVDNDQFVLAGQVF